MPEENDTPASTVSPERVRAFIEMLDKLAYEKPAGFAAYMATCSSAMRMTDFTQPSKELREK